MSAMLESTTRRFAADRYKNNAGRYAWPDSFPHARTIRFRPDHLAFEIHITHEKHHASVQRVYLSGPRVLADGSLSEHRVTESLSLVSRADLPDFVAAEISDALRQVDDSLV